MRKRAGAPLSPGEERANEPSVRDLVRRIEKFRTDSIGGVFALVGPWGSGKTTLADAATALLATDHCWRIAKYEPWAYGDYQSMLDGFFRTLRNQLGIRRLDFNTRKTLTRFFRSVAPFGSIGGVFGVPLQGALTGLAAVSSKRQDFLATRSAANKIFAKSSQPILIVIEDIDRLDSTELMNCFKLIRLLGELDNVYYLLCYDEQTVVDVMQKTDVIGTAGNPRARAYLEKITQIRVDVLDLFGEEQKALWDRKLEEFLVANGLQLWGMDQPRLDKMWHAVFEHYLRSPRSLNRFALQLSSIWESIAGEVNFPDFVAITFLRTFETEVFFEIKESRQKLITGEPRDDASTPQTNEQRRKMWEAHPSVTSARHPKQVFKLLTQVFSGLRDPDDSYAILEYARPRAIDSGLYFDRYFRNALASEEIPERSYRAYLDDVAEGEYCDTSSKVRRALLSRNRNVWERLESEVSTEDRESVLIFQDLSSQYGHLMAVGGLAIPKDPFLVRFALKLERGDTYGYRPFEWYEERVRHFGGVSLVSELLLDGWEYESSLPEGTGRESIGRYQALVEDRISEELHKRPEDADHSVLNGIQFLRQIQDPEETRRLLRESLLESPTWDVSDALVSMLSVGTSHKPDGPQFEVSRYSLRHEVIDHYLGFDWVVENIGCPPPADAQTFSWSDNRPAHSELRNLACFEIDRIQRDRERKARERAASIE